MTRNQRIQTTAHHLRRIYQSGAAVAMRVGAIKRAGLVLLAGMCLVWLVGVSK